MALKHCRQILKRRRVVQRGSAWFQKEKLLPFCLWRNKADWGNGSRDLWLPKGPALHWFQGHQLAHSSSQAGSELGGACRERAEAWHAGSCCLLLCRAPSSRTASSAKPFEQSMVRHLMQQQNQFLGPFIFNGTHRFPHSSCSCW